MNMTRIAIGAILIVIPLSSIIVWNSGNTILESASASDQITAIASFYPLYEFAKQVGKEKINVSLLVPPGIEPHDWEPTIKDIELMKRSNLIIINGVGFEKWIDDVKSISNNFKIIDTSNGILENQNENILHQTPENKHETSKDPHIWLNPIMAKTQVRNIEKAIIELDPENKSYYSKNADNYITKLDSLDYKIRNELSECKKDFIVFHSAFSYFASEYGLHQHTIVNYNPNSEPTPQTLQQLINLAKELHIKVIFAEELVDPRTSEVIANELGGRVLTLSPIEIFEKNSNYVDKMEENLQNLKESICN